MLVLVTLSIVDVSGCIEVGADDTSWTTEGGSGAIWNVVGSGLVANNEVGPRYWDS